ncbi:SAG-related sequence protein SRS22I [Toxoplasma gondii VEG]|uniref:SAG-related sequence protein SRS22I n=1 Tax=Toxoplasma gondii (strain ATCC 50861 / VEG) TaxID=432359 RepID=V4Z7B7_TOXGV|nr:SAG-related sequence protein SRS22I [Toxoplasma gondii VEG]
MKFSLLTLGALAFSAQQAAVVRGDVSQTPSQQGQGTNVCSQSGSLNFNITQGGQSIIFTCDKDIPDLDPKLNATSPEMYEGTNKVHVLEFLPSATLQAVTKTLRSDSDTSGKTYNFTVPILPSDEHHLYVNCTKTTGTGSRSDQEQKDCKVSFYIASSAVRAGLAMSAVVGVVASLLQFA